MSGYVSSFGCYGPHCQDPDADHICVLQNGKVVEQGEHSALVKLEGTYAGAYAQMEREAAQDRTRP